MGSGWGCGEWTPDGFLCSRDFRHQSKDTWIEDVTTGHQRNKKDAWHVRRLLIYQKTALFTVSFHHRNRRWNFNEFKVLENPFFQHRSWHNLCNWTVCSKCSKRQEKSHGTHTDNNYFACDLRRWWILLDEAALGAIKTGGDKWPTAGGLSHNCG